MRGQSGLNTRPDTRLPPIFLGINAWMTSQLNVALARGSLMCLACIFRRVNHGCFYNQAMEDARSIGAGNKCLYCILLALVNSYLLSLQLSWIRQRDRAYANVTGALAFSSEFPTVLECTLQLINGMFRLICKKSVISFKNIVLLFILLT